MKMFKKSTCSESLDDKPHSPNLYRLNVIINLLHVLSTLRHDYEQKAVEDATIKKIVYSYLKHFELKLIIGVFSHLMYIII